MAAALLAGALHLGVAALIWQHLSTHRAPEPSYLEPMFVQILASAQGDPQAREPHTETAIVIDPPAQVNARAASLPASRAPSHKKPATATRHGAGPAPAPTAGSPAANADLASLPRDYAWRPSDSVERGQPMVRGKPESRLSPKKQVERSALAREIAKAARPPCRDLHASKGLLALPFLLADTVTDGGCRW